MVTLHPYPYFIWISLSHPLGLSLNAPSSRKPSQILCNTSHFPCYIALIPLLVTSLFVPFCYQIHTQAP